MIIVIMVIAIITEAIDSRVLPVAWLEGGRKEEGGQAGKGSGTRFRGGVSSLATNSGASQGSAG